jgi:hypothetical protein
MALITSSSPHITTLENLIKQQTSLITKLLTKPTKIRHHIMSGNIKPRPNQRTFIIIMGKSSAGAPSATVVKVSGLLPTILKLTWMDFIRNAGNQDPTTAINVAALLVALTP